MDDANVVCILFFFIILMSFNILYAYLSRDYIDFPEYLEESYEQLSYPSKIEVLLTWGEYIIFVGSDSAKTGGRNVTKFLLFRWFTSNVVS